MDTRKYVLIFNAGYYGSYKTEAEALAEAKALCAKDVRNRCIVAKVVATVANEQRITLEVASD